MLLFHQSFFAVPFVYYLPKKLRWWPYTILIDPRKTIIRSRHIASRSGPSLLSNGTVSGTAETRGARHAASPQLFARPIGRRCHRLRWRRQGRRWQPYVERLHWRQGRRRKRLRWRPERLGWRRQRLRHREERLGRRQRRWQRFGGEGAQAKTQKTLKERWWLRWRRKPPTVPCSMP